MSWNPHFSVLATGILAAAVVLLTAARVLRSAQLPSRGLRATVFVLRLLVFLCVFLVLFNPVRREGLETEASRCPAVFLVDSSASMGLGTPTRAAQVRRAIVEACIDAGPRTQPQILSFDADVSPAPLAPTDLQVKPDGDETLLTRGLSRALEAARGVGAPRVVVFSDGRSHDEARLGRAVHSALSSRTRVDVFPVGVTPERPNLAVLNCLVARHVPAESAIPVQAVLQFTRAEGVPVRLRLLNEAGDTVDETRFVATEGIHEKRLHASLGYDSATFTVELEPLDTELSVDDNTFQFSVTVSDPTIRVLYMEGSNHRDKRWTDKWAYEFIPEALRETGNIDVDVLTVDEQLAEGGKLFDVSNPERGFPTRVEDLMAYDVVICSDINRTIFTPEQLAWTVDLVAKRGGGFCMIGGYTAFGAGKWDKTVWEKMIPVDMRTEKEGYVWETFKPEIPAAVRQHPIWRMDPDPDASSAILDRHPEFLGMNLVNREKPAATVLARCADRDMPVICVQAYGRGRSMAFVSDAAGGWGERYQTEWGEGERDNRYYRRFWSNTVRWLAAHSAARYQTELIGTAEAVNYRPGDTVALRAEKPNQPESDAVSGLRVEARIPGVAGETRLEWDGSSSSFRGELTLPMDLSVSNADILFDAVDAQGNSAGTCTVSIRILRTNREFENPAPDRDLLVRLADLTGGKVLESGRALKELLTAPGNEGGKENLPFSVPLWDRGWLWGLAIALLTVEWLIRKWVSMRGTA